MKFLQQRLFHTDKFSCSFVENEQRTFRSWCLEDTKRAIKIPGQTRIPAGFYELKIRKEETPLTLRHRAAYNKPNDSWFKFHIEVTGIPGFDSVYVHTGNDVDDTEGCLLFAYTFDMSVPTDQALKSTAAVRAFYEKVYPLLEAGERCFIEIRDEPLKTAA